VVMFSRGLCKWYLRIDGLTRYNMGARLGQASKEIESKE